MMSKEARAMFLAGEGTAALDAWKNRYYREKLEMPDGRRRAVTEQYIKGLHWVLQYYYR
jgi:5'-3' exoribonuclease 1